jgi:hypothetical protein
LAFNGLLSNANQHGAGNAGIVEGAVFVCCNRATSMDELQSLPRWRWIEPPASVASWRIISRIGLLLALKAGITTYAGVRCSRGLVL